MPRTFTGFICFSLLLILAWGCSTTQQAARDKSTAGDRDSLSAGIENLDELQTLLAENRSKLSDLYASQKHDMPKAFLKSDSSQGSLNDDPFDGYRVQIVSTRNIQLADSMANQFRMWSDTTISGYSARAYVFFKQPFYKVHIGDFQQRQKANSFSRLIKRRYEDAWVVHDRINPENVPADTANFSFMTSEDRAKRDSLRQTPSRR